MRGEGRVKFGLNSVKYFMDGSKSKHAWCKCSAKYTDSIGQHLFVIWPIAMPMVEAHKLTCSIGTCWIEENNVCLIEIEVG